MHHDVRRFQMQVPCEIVPVDRLVPGERPAIAALRWLRLLAISGGQSLDPLRTRNASHEVPWHFALLAIYQVSSV